MTDSTVIALERPGSFRDELTELLRKGARQLVARAVEAELEELLAVHAGSRTAEGHAAVVRNGYQPEREIMTGIGPVAVRIPRVRSRSGEPVTFRSALAPPYVRPESVEVVPVRWTVSGPG